MSNRETREVKVGEHVLVVNSYITGREAREIESTILDKVEMSQSTTNGTEIKGFKGSVLKEKQDMQVKAVVVSIDGNKENILDTILDLPSTESEKIMELVASIAEPKKEQADK